MTYLRLVDVFGKIVGKYTRPIDAMRHEKKHMTFHYTGWLIGILYWLIIIPIYLGGKNSLYNPTNQGFENANPWERPGTLADIIYTHTLDFCLWDAYVNKTSMQHHNICT